MDLLNTLGIAAIVCGGAYVLGWIMSKAYFDNKADYNRRMLRQLREQEDEEDK